MLSAILSILLSIFTPPVDYDISLAGNFGEPRPHHFHGGLDIKTDGREGKHIYAIADGYVSRITVGKDGFGNAIYITHPTGQTSVYCHLKSFSPRIKAALRRYQYTHQTCEADAHLTPLDVPVARGQFIALSGNTGHSTAPHLHLEMRDTRTGNMLDPYQFLNDFIQDSVPPQVHAIMAVPFGGTFNGTSSKRTFSPAALQRPASSLTAWGNVGFALWANDYMQGSYNHYGIHETLLYVDGQMAFHSIVDDIPLRQNRMVNFWGDYDHWLRFHTWYMKAYIEPGNTLPCLQADGNRGLVSFNEQRDYHLEFVLRDFKANELRIPFTVSAIPPSPRGGVAQSFGVASPSSNKVSWRVGSNAALPLSPVLRWNRTNSYSAPGMQLIVPYGFVATDTPLHPQHRRQPDAYSDAYQFSSASLPLLSDAFLTIHVNSYAHRDIVDTFDPSKLYITNENGRYFGGSYNNGWVTGRIRELAGRYEVAYDDRPPTVRPLSLTGRRLLLSVADSLSGIASWTATVDGRFIVFDAIEKTSTFACELRESWLSPTGKPHRLHFEATDNCGNTQVYETTFTY